MPRKKTDSEKADAPDKTTAAIKAALIAAFEKLGGADALAAWGEGHQTEFYKLWSRLLPDELKNADGDSLRVVVTEEIVDAHVDPQNGEAPPRPAPVPA
jgi:hypothetical protein